MSPFDSLLAVLSAIAAIVLFVVLVVRAELRRERAPRRRSAHDNAYGKGVPMTDAAANADLHFGGGPGGGDGGGD